MLSVNKLLHARLLVVNASIRQGQLPNLWRPANIIPVAKISSLTSINSDLRLMSFNHTLSTVFESVVCEWISNTIIDNLIKRPVCCVNVPHNDKQWNALECAVLILILILSFLLSLSPHLASDSDCNGHSLVCSWMTSLISQWHNTKIETTEF